MVQDMWYRKCKSYSYDVFRIYRFPMVKRSGGVWNDFYGFQFKNQINKSKNIGGVCNVVMWTALNKI